MIIACPNCAITYRVVSSALGAAGRSVRCARCLTVWFAKPAEPAPALETIAPASTTQAVYREEIVADRPPAIASAADDHAFMADASMADEPAADWTAPLEGEADDTANAAAEDIVDAGQDAYFEQAAQDEQAPAAEDIAAAIPAETDAQLPVTEAPPVAPPVEEEAPRFYTGTPPPDDSENFESFATRRLQRQRMRRRNPFASPGLPSAILALIAVVGILIGWRKDLVRLAPQTASFYAAIGLPINLRGLAFEDVNTLKETQDGVPVLVVEGKIVNTAGRPVELPRLRFAVRNGSGQEIYSWTAIPSRSILPPGDSLPFLSRLASPPAEGREVLVRFFNRRDAVTDMR
jgi:predicted Zn finger-like uncharacterized protein